MRDAGRTTLLPSLLIYVAISLAPASALAFERESLAPSSGSAPCTLAVTPLPAPSLPPALLRLGPQYFHASYRGLFLDPMVDSSRYAYYEPGNPSTRSAPPSRVTRVVQLTPHFIVGVGPAPSEETIVVHRTTGVATVVRGASRLHVDDVLETGEGALWILGERVDANGHPGALVLLAGDNSRPAQTLTATRAREWWAAVLGSTGKGEVAAAWIEGGIASAGRVSLRLAWVERSGGLQSAQEMDVITLPRNYADLSIRTRANLALTADGEALAVAWRSLVPPVKEAVDTGDRQHPPTGAFAATVRVVSVSPTARPRLVSRYSTRLNALAFTTGIGPWPLDPGGAWALTLDGRAVFLWLDPTSSGEIRLVGARLRDPQPTVLVRNSVDTLWVARAGSDVHSAVLLAYRSMPDVRAFELRCGR